MTQSPTQTTEGEMSQTIIEKMATAMLDGVSGYMGDTGDLAAVIVDGEADFIFMAKAALTALLSPTEGMIEAAEDVEVLGADLHDFVVFDCAKPVFTAMIQAALDEVQP